MFNKTKIFKLFFIFLVIYRFFKNQNSKLTKSTYKVKHTHIPESFSKYKIVAISDLHNKSFGKNNTHLLTKISKLKPSIIVITGDLINAYSPNSEIAINLVKEAKKIAPVYFISGNHEIRLFDFQLFKKELIQAGAIVLDNAKTKIIRGPDSIYLFGLADPKSYFSSYPYSLLANELDNLLAGVKPDDFTLLLAHRPELMPIYASRSIDLVLSGHAHGGQFRLPFIGGVFAPNQGLFPKYSSGQYTKSDTLMIVSRGLGPSSFPLRLNNKPDLVEVILYPSPKN